MSPRSVYTLFGYYLTLVLFGAFGLALNVFSLLARALLPAAARSEFFFQRLIQRNFALFVWWIGFARLVQVRYRGFERLPHGQAILVANHPTLIDITCLVARVPEAMCIFKPAIRRNPILGSAACLAGYLGSDGGHDLVRLAAAKVAAGRTLIVFPEGTRTPSGERLLPLRPGFVLIARRAGVPIQLVRITTDSNVLTKSHVWWKPPQLPAQVEIKLGPLIATDTAASTRELTMEIETWFRETLADYVASSRGQNPLALPARTHSVP